MFIMDSLTNIEPNIETACHERIGRITATIKLG